MIPVLETSPDVFERLTGNPILNSLDGNRRAPLQVILHASWTPAERAEFGVFLADPFVVPGGEQISGPCTIERQGEAVVEVCPTETIPTPPVLTNQEKADAMLARYGLTFAQFRVLLNIPGQP